VASRPREHARVAGAGRRVLGSLLEQTPVFGKRLFVAALPRVDAREQLARLVVVRVLIQLGLEKRNRLVEALLADALSGFLEVARLRLSEGDAGGRGRREDGQEGDCA
jgi:hypothetical protein